MVAQLRQINTAAAYMPTTYPYHGGYGGQQADEMERLSSALKKHGIDCSSLQNAYQAAFRNTGTTHDASGCTHVTHRCHHAAHAYTGIPCVAPRRKIHMFLRNVYFESYAFKKA